MADNEFGPEVTQEEQPMQEIPNYPPASGSMRIDAPLQSRDPWKHRSEHMKCVTCMWYCQKARDVGRCRKHAPTMGGYPVVFASDWCGDHKLNEEA